MIKSGGICFIYGGEKEFRDKAIAIWFQMVELAWKSRYYDYDKDSKGTLMTEFEEIDEIHWSGNTMHPTNSHIKTILTEILEEIRKVKKKY